MKFLYLGAHIRRYLGVVHPNLVYAFDQMDMSGWLTLKQKVGGFSFTWN